ncbi:MAG: class I SAM-dependent methyltransferase [Pseudomonadota bacterium]
MSGRLLDAAIAIGTRERFGAVRRVVWRHLYNHVTHRLGDDEALCLNYGYLPDGPLPTAPHPEWPNHALYHHVAAPLDLAGKTVIEVGSGRGGGAAYVAKTFAPEELTAFDNAPAGVKAAARIHEAVPNLRFEVGDALALPIADGSVDAVVNVESSHCYASMARFVAEVARVLRPGGRFGLADFRLSSQLAEFDAALSHHALQVDARADITDRVLGAMDHLNAKKSAMIEKRRFFKGIARQWAGTDGSLIKTAFEAGDARYLSLTLTKV